MALDLSGRNLAAFALGGVVVFLGMTLFSRLPQRVARGEQGQAAIEMLDAMRRPFVQIKEEETRLLQTLDAADASRRLETAVDSANSLLGRYQGLARYNPTLSRSVTDLSAIFEDWVATERSFFGCVAAGSETAVTALSTTSRVCDLTPAATRFLHTMNALGAGEAPIHADIADGRRAGQTLQASVGVLLLYLIGLAFWSQRAFRKGETALLQARIRAEEEARALETALGNALTRVLSGFISICASCKRVLAENDEWKPVETYVTGRTEAQFSHDVCPECVERLYGEFAP